MLRNKLSLLLAGAAAYGYYKYSKMSSEEKTRLVNDLKEKGRKLYGQFMPSSNNSMQARPATAGSSDMSSRMNSTNSSIGSTLNERTSYDSGGSDLRTGSSPGTTMGTNYNAPGSTTGSSGSHHSGFNDPDTGDQRSDSYERGIHPMG